MNLLLDTHKHLSKSNEMFCAPFRVRAPRVFSASEARRKLQTEVWTLNFSKCCETFSHLLSLKFNVGKIRHKTVFLIVYQLMKAFFSRQNPQKFVSSLLIVWLSGFVLLFCCGMMEVQAKTEFCPLAKAKSHCDKSKTDDSATSLNLSENETFDCCGFLPAVFDKARKIEKDPQTANIADKVKVERLRFSPVANSFEIAGIYRSPIYDREKIFIRNCVFRI